MRAALLVLALVTEVAANPATADKLAAEANVLAGQGDHKGAAEKFAAAYKEDPQRGTLFCNIGISYYHAQELARAHLLLSRCLERSALEAKFVESAHAVLVQVEGTLRAGGHTPVTIKLEPELTSVRIPELYAEEAFVGTRTVWLPFGTFHLQVHSEGYEDQTIEVTTANPDPQTVTIALQRPKVVPRPIGDPGLEPPPMRRSRLPAYIAGGATFALAVVAGFAYAEASSRADLAHFALDDATFQADKRAVSRWNKTMAVTGGLAIVGAGLTGVLWVRAGKTIEVSPAPGGAAIRGQF